MAQLREKDENRSQFHILGTTCTGCHVVDCNCINKWTHYYFISVVMTTWARVQMLWQYLCLLLHLFQGTILHHKYRFMFHCSKKNTKLNFWLGISGSAERARQGLQYPTHSSCGQRRLWSDWADAQADLSLRWAHSRFVGFVMSRLIWGVTLTEIIGHIWFSESWDPLWGSCSLVSLK